MAPPSACNRFEFHYWRKHCRYCKCPREAHAVAVDDSRADAVELLPTSSDCCDLPYDHSVSPSSQTSHT